MSKRTVPLKIQRIFDKPGREWTNEERRGLFEWLYEPPQLRYLLFFGLRHLGHLASEQDAEDVWAMFCLKRLDKVIKKYNPKAGREFWSWLLFCFQRVCWDEGKKMRRNQKRQSRLMMIENDEEDQSVMLELVDGRMLPQDRVQNSAFLRHLDECLDGLRNPNHRKTFIMCDLKEFSHKEAAQKLGTTVGSVKGWLPRARAKLRDCLTEKEWTQ